MTSPTSKSKKKKKKSARVSGLQSEGVAKIVGDKSDTGSSGCVSEYDRVSSDSEILHGVSDIGVYENPNRQKTPMHDDGVVRSHAAQVPINPSASRVVSDKDVPSSFGSGAGGQDPVNPFLIYGDVTRGTKPASQQGAAARVVNPVASNLGVLHDSTVKKDIGFDSLLASIDARFDRFRAPVNLKAATVPVTSYPTGANLVNKSTSSQQPRVGLSDTTMQTASDSGGNVMDHVGPCRADLFSSGFAQSGSSDQVEVSDLGKIPGSQSNEQKDDSRSLDSVFVVPVSLNARTDLSQNDQVGVSDVQIEAGDPSAVSAGTGDVNLDGAYDTDVSDDDQIDNKECAYTAVGKILTDKVNGLDRLKAVTHPVVSSVATQPVRIAKSYAQAADQSPKRKVNFCTLNLDPPNGVEADLEIPLETVKEASKKYANTLYGYFIGKRLAFPVVQNYVLNVWKKFGIERVMMHANGFFFFKFNSEYGMNQVLEGGPWMIRLVPIILRKWTSDADLAKEDLSKVPVWVKLHSVPLLAFNEVGLSAIATKVGKPLMLDSYTSTMCLESWGRPNFARAMVEVDSENALKENVVVAIPKIEGNGKTLYNVRVEYEWKPPRCSLCKIFGHKDSECPRNVVHDAAKIVDNQVFVVPKQQARGKQPKGNEGFVLRNPKPKFIYRPKEQGQSSRSTNQQSNAQQVPVANRFAALNSDPGGLPDDNPEGLRKTKGLKDRGKSIIDEGEDVSDVEGDFNETATFVGDPKVSFSEGASTPGFDGSNV